MTNDRLREVLKTEPFHRFVIHLADGRRLAVTHPELVALSPSGRTAVVFTSDDASHSIDLPLVAELEIGKGDGRNNRRRRKSN
jgi:hypothetical protein